jgi:hypothetical protein
LGEVGIQEPFTSRVGSKKGCQNSYGWKKCTGMAKWDNHTNSSRA